jgi:hypothetical protein
MFPLFVLFLIQLSVSSQFSVESALAVVLIALLATASIGPAESGTTVDTIEMRDIGRQCSGSVILWAIRIRILPLTN